MVQQPERESEHTTSRGPFLPALLQAIGFIDLIITVLGTLSVLALRLHQQQPLTAVFVAALVGGLICGLTLGGFLIGFAVAVRSPASNEDIQRERRTSLPPSATDRTHLFAEDQPLDSESASIERILAVLADVRDIQILDPQTRDAAIGHIRGRAQRRAVEDVVDAINTRQLGKARELLRDAAVTYGKTTTMDRLGAKIDEAAKRNEALDYARTKRLVEDEISAGHWALAETYAHTFRQDHPDSAPGRQLWDDTRRARLYAHIQESAQQHRWAEALAAAEEFLERFPDGREAEALRKQLVTLTTNAEILQRKQYEERFKAFLSEQQFSDALRIAKYIVEHYPDSPQARALHDQIPILEKRAAT